MGQVVDAPALRVYRKPVAGLDVAGLLAYQQRQSEVKSVAVKQTGVGGGDDGCDAKMTQRTRRLLARGAHAEIFSADHKVARFDLAGEARLDRLKAVLRNFLDAEFHVEARRQHVGVEVVAEHPGIAAHVRTLMTGTPAGR